MRDDEVHIRSYSGRGDDGRLFLSALAALVLLLASNLLYPDTSTNVAVNLGAIRLSPLGTMFVVTAPFLLIYGWSRRHKVSISALDVLLLTTMTYLALRGVLAATTANGVALTAGYAAYSLTIYYGAAVLAQRPVAIRVITITIVSIGFIVVTLGLLEFFLERNVLYEGLIKQSSIPFQGAGYHRSGSTLGHPLALGLFLVQIAPFFVIFFAKADTILKRIAWGLVIIGLVLTLLVTFSKGPWGTAGILAASAVAYLLWKKPEARKLTMVLVVSVVLSSALFFVVFHENTMAGTFSRARTSESLSPRKYMWSRTPAVIGANPVFGVGMWQSGPEVSKIDPVDLGENQPTAIDNLYLTIIVEDGLVGALLLLVTLALVFRQAIGLFRGGGDYATWGAAYLISMGAVIINGITMDTLLMWPGMVMFWLMAGMTRAMYEMKRRKTGPGEIW